MKIKDLVSILSVNALEGVEIAGSDFYPSSTGLTKAKAYQLYGRSNIDRWVKERLIFIEHGKINKKRVGIGCSPQQQDNLSFGGGTIISVYGSHLFFNW